MSVFTVETRVTHRSLMHKTKYALVTLVMRLLDDNEVLRKKAMRYPNGAPMFDNQLMMLDDQGNRSIFDDVDA